MKSDYNIRKIVKKEATPLLKRYHYLTNLSRDFKSGFNYGLFFKDFFLVGVIIFTGLPVPELAKGMLGLERYQQKGLFELSRLVLHPHFQEVEHNLASFFIAKAIKSLRSETSVRAILSYADNDFHSGIVYQACNFIYCGLSSKRSDFWIRQSDNTFIKHNRGPLKHLEGEWRPRSQKHRFVLIFDKTLTLKWKVQKYLKKESL